jgi:hypothetical protein
VAPDALVCLLCPRIPDNLEEREWVSKVVVKVTLALAKRDSPSAQKLAGNVPKLGLPPLCERPQLRQRHRPLVRPTQPFVSGYTLALADRHRDAFGRDVDLFAPVDAPKCALPAQPRVAAESGERMFSISSLTASGSSKKARVAAYMSRSRVASTLVLTK